MDTLLAQTRLTLNLPNATASELAALVDKQIAGVKERHRLTIDIYKKTQYELAYSRLQGLRDGLLAIDAK